jgi:hypothetical protein
MTDQHPLTDEIIEEIARFDPDEDDMRAAFDKGADWRLEQVIEWVSKSGWYFFEHSMYEMDFIYELKRAMRPQEKS